MSVIDDRLARVGSANLNNRSGGFDTECELAVEGDDEDARRRSRAFRDRLVGHFMGCTGDAVAKARADYGGLVGAIDALNRDGRLQPIEPPRDHRRSASSSPSYHLGDPQDADGLLAPRAAAASASTRRRAPSTAATSPARRLLRQITSKSITSGRWSEAARVSGVEGREDVASPGSPG